MHIISKISDVKARIQDLNTSFLITNLEVLKVDLINTKPDNDFIKYIPIAVVACFETFFKIVFAEFIDFGEPYLTNTQKLQKERKIEIDYKTVIALHGKKFSLGDLFAFSLKYSTFDTIRSNFEIILGNNKDLIKELKNITTYDLYDKSNQDEEILIVKSQIDEIVIDVYKTYNLRHIYSHEYNHYNKTNLNETLRLIDSAISFLKAIERFMWDTIYKELPITQSEMNQYAVDQLEKSDQKLKEIESLLFERIGEYGDEFKNIQELWREYREKNANLLADFNCKGGTIWPTLYASYMTLSTEKRIEELKWILKQE